MEFLIIIHNSYPAMDQPEPQPQRTTIIIMANKSPAMMNVVLFTHPPFQRNIQQTNRIILTVIGADFSIRPLQEIAWFPAVSFKAFRELQNDITILLKDFRKMIRHYPLFVQVNYLRRHPFSLL